MGILTAFLAVLSCALIGAGVWLVLRDIRRTKEQQAAPARLSPPDEGQRRAIAREAHPAPRDGNRRPHPNGIVLPPSATHTDPPGLRAAAPGSLEDDLMSALRAVNGAFAPAGIVLVCAPADALSAQAPPLVAASVMAGEHRAGLLHMRLSDGVVEITAVSDVAGPEAVQRVRRLSLNEASIPSLAEAMAACAWPLAQAALSTKPAKS